MARFYTLRELLSPIRREGEGDMAVVRRETPRPAGSRVAVTVPPSSVPTRLLKVAVDLDRKKRLCRARMEDAMDEQTRAYWQGRTSAFQEARDLCEGRL